MAEKDRPDGVPDFDRRPTVRIHVGMPESKNIAPLSDSAFRLFIEAICYCGREENNGDIPKVILAKQATKRTAVAELQQRGHLVELDAETWHLPDYLRWNRAADEIQSFRASKASSGTLGAHQRWHVPRRRKDKDCPYCYPLQEARDA